MKRNYSKSGESLAHRKDYTDLSSQWREKKKRGRKMTTALNADGSLSGEDFSEEYHGVLSGDEDFRTARDMIWSAGPLEGPGHPPETFAKAVNLRCPSGFLHHLRSFQFARFFHEDRTVASHFAAGNASFLPKEHVFRTSAAIRPTRTALPRTHRRRSALTPRDAIGSLP